MGVLRITGGSARGRTVSCPDLAGVRPTSSRVREALFSVVGQDLSGLRVLDAFGGSGLMALEAWSRGAEVTVVERDPRVCRHLEATARALGARWALVRGDVRTLAPQLGPFDGVIADPPYADDVAGTLDALAPRTRAWLVLEAATTTRVPTTAGALACDRVRMFGETALHVFWAQEEA
jgi:16S rRNA (guanine966-N2)-methyltransferase